MIRITWLKPEERIEHEIHQLQEAGVDTRALEARWAPMRYRDSATQRQVALMLLSEAGAMAAMTEMSDGDIAAFVASLSTPSTPVPEDTLPSKLQGAWVGRAVGCLLGKPVEKIPREGIRTILKSTGDWPLSAYFTEQGLAAEVAERYPWNRASHPTSLQENIHHMPEDDDLNYTMLNLHVLETYGRDFTTDDVATTWLQLMPVLTVFTAERVAYENLLAYRTPPETATHHNPYREWIGAQIRADMWGYVNPGNPVAAARMAYRDARLSHTENGVFGEMFVAAMISAAFTTTDLRTIIDAGLAVIPEELRLAEAIRFSVSLPDRTGDCEAALDLLYERYGHYHWVHTINNAALVVTALIYGSGDFSRTICNAVMGGWDTDCNGATTGSIVGAMYGIDAIPKRWYEPFNNTLRTSLKSFDYARFDDLAARTLAQVKPWGVNT